MKDAGSEARNVIRNRAGSETSNSVAPTKLRNSTVGNIGSITYEKTKKDYQLRYLDYRGLNRDDNRP